MVSREESKEYGTYAILRAVNHNRHGEATNLGCSVYNMAGVQIGYKVDDTARAIMRGDLDPVWGYTRQILEDTIEHYNTIDRVRKTHESTGHAMSGIQIGDLCGTLIWDGVVDHIYNLFVSGIRKQ